MGWRRNILERVLPLATWSAPSSAVPLAKPASIFVLRNNDIGDLIVVTPLFEALRRLYPETEIIAGIGDWNRAVLENNPWISRVMPVNAPWHNKSIRDQSPRAMLRYLFRSPEVSRLRDATCSMGIDVLGSQWGAWLLCRAGIPYRIGVRGYAGGDSIMQAGVPYEPHRHVGESALRVATLLGATSLPPVRPQLFLTEAERADARLRWAAIPRGRRVVVSPGGGTPDKCWPLSHYRELVQLLRRHHPAELVVIGPAQDHEAARVLAEAGALNWTGAEMNLRRTFAVIAESDFAIVTSSMAMHAAAAFAIPTVALLGEHFPSADAHARQWGYAGQWCNLGKTSDHPGLTTPAEALAVILPQLQGLSR